jgi:hypothetical protein
LLNYRASGRKPCYAAKGERCYPNVLRSRENNARIIEEQTALGSENLATFTSSIALEIDSFFKRRTKKPSKVKTSWKKSYTRTVRLNEAGDISPENIDFHISLIRSLRALKIRVYMYSKAPQYLQDQCKAAGAVVLQSERDFVAVSDPCLTTLPLCKSSCGSCLRCPKGLQTAILEH